MYNSYKKKLDNLKNSGNLRVLAQQVSKKFINLSSNDYLGILDDNNIVEEFREYANKENLKFGSASSRLLTGNSAEYSILEKTIAKSYNKQACLVYNSGYHANIGILPALSEKNDLIISDKLVHASIIDGIRLSRADRLRYNHLDNSHLDKILTNVRHKYNNVFIVTESIFSMDGDIAFLPDLVKIKNKYKAFLYVDEAHALGVRGDTGLACAEEYNCIDDIDFIIGTFGKAIASIGAYIVCNQTIKSYLVNHSRSMIFTTGLPPVNLAWTNFIFNKLKDFEYKRQQLRLLSEKFAKLLKTEYSSHIIPYIVGSSKLVMSKSDSLQKNGFYALPIRHPTVEKGTERLRFSLKANLDYDKLLKIPEIIF